MLTDVCDDLRNRFLEWLSSPGSRYDAKIAIVNATPCPLEHVVGQIIPARQQVSACKRATCEIEPRCLTIALAHSTCDKIPNELRPRIFGIADHHRIRMRFGVL